MEIKPYQPQCTAINAESTMTDYVERYLFLLKPDNIYEHGGLIVTAILDLLYHEGKSCREGYSAFCHGMADYFHVDVKIVEKALTDFHSFFLHEADQKAVNAILRFWHGSRESLTDYQILQASASYIMCMMRKYGYKDDADPRYKTVAFTGPRPEKLPKNIDLSQLEHTLMQEILTAIDEGFEIFYSGMSRGVDMIAAKCVLEARQTYPQVKLHAAIPFVGQADLWNDSDREQYEKVLSLADKITIISPFPFKQAYLVRSEFMIRNAALLITVYDGKSGGGTKYAVDYAQKTMVQIITRNPDTLMVKAI